MFEEDRTANRQFVEVSFVYFSRKSASEGEDKLQSQLIVSYICCLVDRIMSSREVERSIKAIAASFTTQLELLF